MSTLYISDLDGTLLDNDAALSDYSRATLLGLLDEGLLFTVASARSVIAMQQMLHGIPLTLPVIEFNGAFISDLATGHHEIINALDTPVVESVFEIIRGCGSSLFVSSFNGSEDCVYYRDITNDGMRWYIDDRMKKKDRRWRTVEDFRHSFADDVVCMTVIGALEDLSEMEHAIIETHGPAVATHLFENLYSPGWYWLTTHDRRATKDQAVRTLVEAYGLQGNEIVAFGDQSNDIRMLKAADRAIAVANGSEELRCHAHRVIGPNHESSVMKFIQEEWELSRNSRNIPTTL